MSKNILLTTLSLILFTFSNASAVELRSAQIKMWNEDGSLIGYGINPRSF